MKQSRGTQVLIWLAVIVGIIYTIVQLAVILKSF
jgi:hypothetical protein